MNRDTSSYRHFMVTITLFVLGLLLIACTAAQPGQPLVAAATPTEEPAEPTAAPAEPTEEPAEPTEEPTEEPAEPMEEPAESGAESIQLKVVALPFMSFAPFFIAQEEGFYTEQGLEVEFVNLTGQADALPALLSGEVDVIAGLVNVAYLNTIARGGDLKIVSDKGYIDPAGCSNFAILAPQPLIESGVAVTDPEELQGKSISSVAASWQSYYLTRALETVGLGLGDVEEVYIASPSLVDAMNEATVFLAVQNEPWVTRLIAAGHEAVFAPVEELLPQSQSAVNLYGERLLNEDVEAGQRFMVAYLKAVAQYNEGKTDRNVEILSGYIGLTPEELQAMCWPTLRADGSIDVASVLDFQEWAIEHELLESPVTEEQFWDPRFIEYANEVLGTEE